MKILYQTMPQRQFCAVGDSGKIEFDKVFFAYADDRYVLKNISFLIEPGQTVAIVGHTGSGKTSIISLLNRLYHIQQGSIKVDDVNIEQYNLDVLRSRIGIVLQDVFLFPVLWSTILPFATRIFQEKKS